MISSVFSRQFRPSVSKVIALFLILEAFYANVKGEVTVKNSHNLTVAVFFDVELGISAKIPREGIVGQLVLADPEDACHPINPAPPKSDPDTVWFVLIRRLPCPFKQKVCI